MRQAESKPLIDALKSWLESELRRVSGKSVIAGAIRYGLKHWDGLVRFLADGRIEMDTNAVERAIRPVAMTESFYTLSVHSVNRWSKNRQPMRASPIPRWHRPSSARRKAL